MASSSGCVKNPREKRKVGHQRILRPIARNRIIHQKAEIDERIERRRGGMVTCEGIVQGHGSYKLLRATVTQSGSATLAVTDAMSVQPIEHDPRGSMPRLAHGYEAVAEATRMARAIANGLHVLQGIVDLPPACFIPTFNAEEVESK